MISTTRNLISEEESEKKIIIGSVRSEAGMRKGVFAGIILLFLIINLVLKPFPYYYHSFTVCVLMLSIIFPIRKYIEKHPNLSLHQVQLILVVAFILEMTLMCVLFYFFLPIGIYYIREMMFLVICSLNIYFVTTYPIIRSKKYNNLFLFLCLLILILIGIIEYKRLFPFYPNYPVQEHMFPSPFITLASVLGGGLIFFITGNKLNYYWELLTEINLQLKKLNVELEERVRKRTKELEKSKRSLEVKVKARTSELEGLNKTLDQKVKQRTKELEERINELEKFHKITIGRELKMVELKREVERLKKELEEKKK